MADVRRAIENREKGRASQCDGLPFYLFSTSLLTKDKFDLRLGMSWVSCCTGNTPLFLFSGKIVTFQFLPLK
jgi:hypothetical protein